MDDRSDRPTEISTSESNLDTSAVSDVSASLEQESRTLTYVNLKNEYKFELPNVLIMNTRNLTKSEVERSIDRGIKKVVTNGNYQPSSINYFINFTTIYNKLTNSRTPKGLSFVYFIDAGFPNIFLGLNPNGTERIELYQDPNWVPEEWDNCVEEQNEEFTWDNINKGFDFTNPNLNWADAIEEENREKSKREPVMLERKMDPIAVLYGEGVNEEKFEISCESGFAKIKKEKYDGYAHSILFVHIPTWANLFELRKIFSFFSKSESYPILEYSVDVKGTGSLFVTYSPGSDGAMLANLILFKYPYSRNGMSSELTISFSKAGTYERAMSRGKDNIITITSRTEQKNFNAIPEEKFRKKLAFTQKEEPGIRSGSFSDKWRSNNLEQGKYNKKSPPRVNKTTIIKTPPKNYTTKNKALSQPKKIQPNQSQPKKIQPNQSQPKKIQPNQSQPKKIQHDMDEVGDLEILNTWMRKK